MDDIRVTYSGLLGFVVAMGGMLAGLAFTIVVTRQLEPEEFGAWAIIGSMVSYSVTAEPIISYWTARQGCEGKAGRKDVHGVHFVLCRWLHSGIRAVRVPVLQHRVCVPRLDAPGSDPDSGVVRPRHPLRDKLGIQAASSEHRHGRLSVSQNNLPGLRWCSSWGWGWTVPYLLSLQPIYPTSQSSCVTRVPAWRFRRTLPT